MRIQLVLLHQQLVNLTLKKLISESQGPDSLEDFCRDRGVCIKLKNDHARMEIGKAWMAICCKYSIAQCTTEAHMPWQDEVEWYVQGVKKMVNIIMDVLTTFGSCVLCMWCFF